MPQSDKPIALFSGSGHPELAEQVAGQLRIPLGEIDIGSFADGETRVCVREDVREATVVIVQPTCPPVNEHLLELALITDAARAAGARRVIGIVPYVAYTRQEQRSTVGEPRSAQVIARLLHSVGLDHIVTLDLHAPALESAFPMPATLLQAKEVFVDRITGWGSSDLVIVSPDAGGMKRVQGYALELECDLAVIAKHRSAPDVPSPLRLLGDVADRDCLIVDDMASTGRTMARAAEMLREAGARTLRAIFTHAVMAPDALQRLEQAGFERVLTTDSVPVPDSPLVEVVSVGPLLARTITSLLGERR